jgi:hypothetical protein
VIDYRQKEGIEGDIVLLFNADLQTKVDEWKEYHYFEHQALAPNMAKAEESFRRREQQRIEWPGPAESALDRYLTFLTWVEDQIPIIAQECDASNKQASSEDTDPLNPADGSEAAAAASGDVGSFTQRSHNSPQKGKKSTPSVLKAVDTGRISKAGRDAKGAAPSRYKLPWISPAKPEAEYELVLTKAQMSAARNIAELMEYRRMEAAGHIDLERLEVVKAEAIRVENERVKAQMEAARIKAARIEVLIDHDKQAPAVRPAPLRRSQRIMDRDAKRILGSQNLQPAAHGPKPVFRRKSRGKASDNRNPGLPEAKAKVRRVKGSRITKKKAASAGGSKKVGKK